MDPRTCLLELLSAAARVAAAYDAGGVPDPDDADTMAERLRAIVRWCARGGTTPRRWRAPQGAYNTADTLVALLDMADGPGDRRDILREHRATIEPLARGCYAAAVWALGPDAGAVA